MFKKWCEYVEANSLSLLKTTILSRTVTPDGDDVFSINLRPELLEIIREAKLLERLGLKIPEGALNIALQEKKYTDYTSQLRAMLRDYIAVTSMLDAAERSLLEKHLIEFQRVLRPGAERLNWTSLGIPDFVSKCNTEINKFQGLVSQVKKNSTIVQQAVDSLSRAGLVKEPVMKSGVVNLDAHVRICIVIAHTSGANIISGVL